MDSDFPKNAQRRLFISTYLRDVGASDNEQFLDGFEVMNVRLVHKYVVLIVHL